MKEYVKIFNGYRHAYGIADWTNATVDPESGKKKPDYRWTYEEFTDQIYQDHLTVMKNPELKVLIAGILFYVPMLVEKLDFFYPL